MKSLRSFSLILVLASVSVAQVASGGSYTLVSTVIANGGTSSSGGTHVVSGTTGQSVAGVNSTGGEYAVHSGFWQSEPLAPTAAPVNIRGRITMAGRGISRVRVYLTDATGITRSVMTNRFGFYRFSEVEAGQSYIIGAQHRHYAFADNPRLVNAIEELFGIDFSGERQH